MTKTIHDIQIATNTPGVVPEVDEEYIQIFLALAYEEQLQIIEHIRYNYANELFTTNERDYYGGKRGLWLRRLKTLYDWWMGKHGEEWAVHLIWSYQETQFVKENTVE